MRGVQRDLPVVAAVAAVLALTLPLQAYLGNTAVFPFAFGRLLPELMALAFLFTVGLLLLAVSLRAVSVRLCPRLDLSVVFLSLLTAALVCVYLESGILSAGLPELNGGPVSELANRARGAVDAGVWLLLLVLAVVFARVLRPFLHWIALAVLILSAASLVDVLTRAGASAPQGGLPSAPAAFGARPASFVSQPTVVANVRYSPTRNIFVFVLDSVPGLSTLEAVGTNGALVAKFPGFTAYPQNIGMHECTKRGVPGLVTGVHFAPETVSEADYPMTMYGTNSFVCAAEEAGWSVAFSPDLLPYGRTNLPIERRVARVEKRRSRDRLAILRQSTEVPYLSLFDLVAFRLAPFLFKGPILYSRIRHAVKGRHSDGGFWGERSLYAELAARPIDADPRPFLGLFHSWGVHPPWARDFATAVTDKLLLLGRLMDAYRAAGIYEKSLIVVTSDHGLDEAKPVGAFPPSASALLWVKPENASGAFSVSEAATSHAQVAALVKAALAAPVKAASCEELLVPVDGRLYRAEMREGMREFFRDWRDAPKRRAE